MDHQFDKSRMATIGQGTTTFRRTLLAPLFAVWVERIRRANIIPRPLFLKITSYLLVGYNI
jgi:hypothetical protein